MDVVTNMACKEYTNWVLLQSVCQSVCVSVGFQCVSSSNKRKLSETRGRGGGLVGINPCAAEKRRMYPPISPYSIFTVHSEKFTVRFSHTTPISMNFLRSGEILFPIERKVPDRDVCRTVII